jgi:hypothetical protein
MSVKRIQVIAYSGYRDEQTPRALTLNDEKIEVTEILERWVEEGLEDREARRCFIVKGSDGRRHRLYYDEKLMEWYYVDKG